MAEANPSPVAAPTAISRPWYGTLLGVINAIVMVFLGLLLLGLFLSTLTGWPIFHQLNFDTIWIVIMTSVAGIVLSILTIIIFLLEIPITIGYFKGTRWVVIVSMVLGMLGTLSALGNLRVSVIPFILNGLLLWAEVMCFKHPFYNK